jgi:hypothetical protein
MSIFPVTTVGVLAQTARAAPRRRALAIAFTLAFAVGAPGGAAIAVPQRVTAVVGNCNDSGAGSLRDVMTSAMSGDTVDVRALPCSTITLTTGQINVGADSVTLLGPGVDALTIKNGTYSTKYDNRIFAHSGAGVFTIVGMTLADGVAMGSVSSPNAYGGCIRSAGDVVLSEGAVKNCSAAAAYDENGIGGAAGGGGIFAHKVFLQNSTVSGCSVASLAEFLGGGGVMAPNGLRMFGSELSYNRETGTKYGGGGAAVGGLFGDAYSAYTLIANSTIAGNSARMAAGLFLASGEVRIYNSTISGNMASRYGGGIHVGQFCGAEAFPVIISNSTITGNQVSDDGFGSGAYMQGCVDLQSTIIAGNFPNDVGGSTAALSGANNMVGASTASTPALPPGTIVADPHLGVLAYNGGGPRTHALRWDSPAIDFGNNAAELIYDQRGSGYPRVVGAQADIGAFEFADRIFQDGFD